MKKIVGTIALLVLVITVAVVSYQVFREKSSESVVPRLERIKYRAKGNCVYRVFVYSNGESTAEEAFCCVRETSKNW